MEAQQPAPETKPLPAPTARKRWYKRWWFRALAGLALFFILLVAVLPLAAKYGLEHWLKKNGADQAVIDSIRYNPFRSRISLRGLAVDAGGHTLLSDGVFTIDLGLRHLFDRNIHVEEAFYHDLMLDMEQKPDGSWRFGAYSLTPGDKTGDKTPVQPDGPPSKWIFSAQNVTLANCKIHFKTPELDLILVVDEARLSGFSTSALAPPATFNLKGTLNGKAVVINLDTVKIVPSLTMGGKLDIAAFDLAIVKKYVERALPDFAGQVSLDGRGSFSRQDGLMKAAYDGQITVAQPLVGNQTFHAAAKTLSWKGAADYHLAKNDSGVTTKGTLSAGGLTVGVPGAGFSLKHDSMTLAGDCAVPIAPALAVHHNGTLATTGTAVHVLAMKIGQRQLNWQGKTDWSMPDGVSRAVFTGALTTGGSSYENGPMRAGAESVTVAEVSGDIGTKIALKTFAASGLSFSTGGKEALIAKVAAVNVAAAASDDLIDWHTQNIGVEKVEVSLLGAMPLNLSLLGLNIDRVSSAEKAAIWKTGGLTLRDFSARSPRENHPLAAMDMAKITAVKASKEGRVQIGEVDLDGLRFLGSDTKDAIASLDRLRLRHSAFSLSEGFSAASLDLNDLTANLERDKEGRLNAVARLQALLPGSVSEPEKTPEAAAATARPAAAKTDGKAGEEAKPLPIRLGEVAVDGHIFYHDLSLPIDFVTDAKITNLTIKDIDSTNPAQRSAIQLLAELAGRAPLEVKGDMALFGGKPDLAFDIHLKNYPLSRLSPFTAQAVGTALASGELKSDATVSLKGDYLTVKNKVLLQKLETKTLSPELAAKLNNQLPLPLDAALALLRDSQGNISLDIPVEGELSSLHVGLSSIIITALSKAIVPAASAYLVYALGPYGALAYVGTKVGQKMMQVSLPPVAFVPGQAELAPAKDDYLQRVGKILADRPNMDLQLTPRVVTTEFNPPAAGKAAPKPDALSPELTKKLNALGQNRAKALRQRLHDQFGVDMNRLMISETQIVADGEPQVLLSM